MLAAPIDAKTAFIPVRPLKKSKCAGSVLESELIIEAKPPAFQTKVVGTTIAIVAITKP